MTSHPLPSPTVIPATDFSLPNGRDAFDWGAFHRAQAQLWQESADRWRELSQLNGIHDPIFAKCCLDFAAERDQWAVEELARAGGN